MMRKRVAIIVPVLLLIVAATVLTNLFPFRQMLAADRAVASAEADLARLQETNAVLERELEALQTPEEVERLARDELGYVYPGEQAFVVVDPDDESSPPVVAEEAPLPEPRPWFAPIVDFFTGRDLEG